MHAASSVAHPSHVSFTELTDLASERLGSRTLACSDDFFAPMENLLKPQAPIFIPDKYTDLGKWMDGWESRRKRNLAPGNDHDWCVIQLGAPGVISGVDIDTAYFTGNYPEFAQLEAVTHTGPAPRSWDDLKWSVIVPKTALQGGSHNLRPVSDSGRFTHLRLRIFPDGGVARLRVYGQVMPEWSKLKGEIDLAGVVNGGKVIVCNDMYFSPKENLILPERAANMGEGWETKRKRGPGFDWIIVRLGTTGQINRIEIDTNHFKGNFPESCSVEACAYRERDLLGVDFRDRKDLEWKEILPRVKLQASHQHSFDSTELRATDGKYDYVRLNIYPDGGVSRMRIWGSPA